MPADIVLRSLSGIAQAFFAQLLSEPHLNHTNESWGLDGFARWICDIRRQYSSKRDRLLNGISKHCSPEHIRCKPCPQSGMFAWLEVNLDKHPEFTKEVREKSGNQLGPKTNTTELIQRLFDLCIDGALIPQKGSFKPDVLMLTCALCFYRECSHSTIQHFCRSAHSA